MKVYALIRENGKTNEYICDKNALKGEDVAEYIELKITGKTYREKQSNLEELAKETQLFGNKANGKGLSYGELAILQNFFAVNGKRYGLLDTFRTECIC